MKLIDAIIQGIIQGFTEFLPVSSSGHLALYQHYFGSSDESGLFFSAILHLGTLLATFIAFRKDIIALIKELGVMICDLFKGKLFKTKMNPQRRMIVMLIVSCLVLVPCVPFKSLVEDVSEKYMIVLGCLFLYTSAILFLSDRCVKGNRTIGDITCKNALTVGIFQAIALFPGVSRSGSTIAGGLFSGFTRETAVKYSFILGIPTILAGCLLEFKDAVDASESFENPGAYFVGFLVSAVVGVCAIKMVSWLVKSNKFTIFSIYTLILGLTVIGYELYQRIA
ncbi:MAG: undecaprenyl-diphosphate phosphatase [Ruminococcus sp.]|jgi:undecaprenyl-diphosphatase|nr:undecaprenyl-diphosphate phosphatase [Ruminococcus sp.]